MYLEREMCNKDDAEGVITLLFRATVVQRGSVFESTSAGFDSPNCKVLNPAHFKE
jgi:hypothetical protein